MTYELIDALTEAEPKLMTERNEILKHKGLVIFLDASLQQAFEWGWEAREKLIKSGYVPEEGEKK